MNFNSFNEPGNKDIKHSKNKTFDINEYNTEDLVGILNLTQEAPINKDKIDEKIKKLKYELRNNKKKSQIFPFLEMAAKKLKKQFEYFNQETWEEAYENDDSEASNVLKQQYQDIEFPGKNLIINQQSNIIGRVKQTIQDKMAIQGTVQGDKNPIQRKTIKRIVNFDSHYRQILDPSAVNCSGIQSPDPSIIVANPQIRLYTSTNYTVNLNQPLLNVVDITVDNVEIPYSWYVFSQDYGTNSFQVEINNIKQIIKIPEGNYSTSSSLISKINSALSETLWPAGPNNTTTLDQLINFNPNLTSINNKVTIDVVQETTLIWYIEDDLYGSCSSSFRETPNSLLEPPKPGNKINYNLGWLLGFRTQSTTIKPGSYTPQSTIDIYGPKYLLLTLDDYNNNKPNKDLISLIDNTTNNFTLPGYYKPQSMNPSIFDYGTTLDNSRNKYQPGKADNPNYLCLDVAGPPSDRGCAVNDINSDLASNLTEKQQYSVSQMIQANTTSNRKPRYSSPNSSDILLRIPINNPPDNNNQIISFKNEKPEETKRIYFGPVNLRKFNVRLLNDKGFEVNLNDRDWSFSLIINQLYQF